MNGDKSIDMIEWINLCIPIFIFLIIIFGNKENVEIALKRARKRRGGIKMSNELIKKYIGKNCMLSTEGIGGAVIGEIIDVVDNWIEVKTKKENQLLNSDYITNIKELPAK